MYVTAQINFLCSGAGSSDAHVQKLSFFNSEEHRRCHQVWSNTFESKGMKFSLIELNEPIN